MKTRFTLCLALFSTLLLSCGEDIEPTEVVLVVDSDLTPPTQVDSIDVTVITAGGEEMIATARLGVGDARLPRTLGIYNMDARLGPYRVVARARLGGATIVQRSASFDFVRDRTMRLSIFLSSLCVDVRCDEPTTCAEGGVCRSSEVDLEPWTGNPAGISISLDAGTD